MELLISFLTLALYSGAAGYYYPRHMAYVKGRCKTCSGKRDTSYYTGTCFTDHGVGGVFSALVWPLMVFVLAGNSKGYDHADGISRTERKRQREIAQAEHKVELAKLAAQETEHLNRQLRAAGKPELVHKG